MALVFLFLPGASQANPPFSGPKDVAFAESLWKAMEKFHMVGPNRFQSMPYETPPPHGHMVEVLEGNISVDGRKALVIVKKNFGKTKKETRQDIADNPDAFITSITVMFRREAGCIACHSAAPGGDYVFIHDRYK